ncbi:MAG: rhomboid family intramembrane serine protease [Bacteroidetes bacterium GWC2_33_15]|nr:MAG: rhomboid family intramembrane serine protease [Bacteroidetes bacterium GWA2_33_15]OFX48869.1 MAG: rhomboid family intramembrane serine protease [Bacteroidetes bacterium GWC2_33_15]OFX66112.1 MAG: rhomboid family intramembrane serine protease [Bacteroidetes bacterium GWB2_32_14]OFX68126.1 MAG: rhomboid family intramembrane serine protease [Bacteroidetes bacterium GWD2_33_33]HAN17895.1 rhomboid family intramembrane serine protease [Bacteroidales bacterium]
MTLLLIALTSIISFLAFNNSVIFEKMQLNPYQVYHKKEWYRIVSHGFLHADWIHLIVNMLVLYSFGSSVEQIFRELAGQGIIHSPVLSFVILYFASMIMATVTTVKKQKDNIWYNSVGASGAVSAVVFTSIFFQPMSSVYFYAVIPIPGIIFGVLYLAYSHYMSRRGSDNINHDAHFIGAVFGFIFPLFLDPKLIRVFLDQLLNF